MVETKTKPAAKKTAAKPKEPVFVTVKCDLLNVRIKPDITSQMLGQVSKNTKLEKISAVKDGKWLKIWTGHFEDTEGKKWARNLQGYVMTEFIC